MEYTVDVDNLIDHLRIEEYSYKFMYTSEYEEEEMHVRLTLDDGGIILMDRGRVGQWTYFDLTSPETPRYTTDRQRLLSVIESDLTLGWDFEFSEYVDIVHDTPED